MTANTSLNQYLGTWSQSGPGLSDIAEALGRIAITSIKLADIIGQSFLTADKSDRPGLNSAGHDPQPLDTIAHQLFEDGLRDAPVGLIASRGSEDAILINPGATLAVAINPLDSSTNIDSNLPVGTTFSIFARGAQDKTLTLDGFINKSGNDQVAAGFIVYGPQTLLILSCLNGSHIFALHRARAEYFLVRENMQIPSESRELAIDAANYSHWDSAVRGYIDDCIAGQSSPRSFDFNMQWAASLTAEAYRILVCGGICLYPRDIRTDLQNGQPGLLYDAFPIALLAEQAGAAATNGVHGILEKSVIALHERTALVFGSKDEVERVARYRPIAPVEQNRYPLFASRSLLRN